MKIVIGYFVGVVVTFVALIMVAKIQERPLDDHDASMVVYASVSWPFTLIVIVYGSLMLLATYITGGAP